MWFRLSCELDELGGDGYGGGEQAGEGDEEAAGAGASEGEECAGASFEGSADDAYAAPYHCGGELGGEVVFSVGS